MKVGCEACEPVFVHGDITAFESVPEAVGFGFADAVIYPARWDILGEFVVKDCLEGRDDLEYVRAGMWNDIVERIGKAGSFRYC